MSLVYWTAIMLGSSADPSGWPDLPTTAFISGRPATVADAEQGNAAFSMDGQAKSALEIDIPQYAWWTDENGSRHPVIVIQAEEAPDGTKIIGLLKPDGQHMVATGPELTLLGKSKPD
jgi:hypothetical protein